MHRQGRWRRRPGRSAAGRLDHAGRAGPAGEPLAGLGWSRLVLVVTRVPSATSDAVVTRYAVLPKSTSRRKMSPTAPWCSGLTRHPVKVETGGSNPLGVATTTLWLWTPVTTCYHVSMYGRFFPVLVGVGGRRFSPLTIQVLVSAGSITSSRPPPAAALTALALS